jgi:aryl-alcohol dehydrogenase-like predicted oxidoreductase
MQEATSKLEAVAKDAGMTLVELAYRWIVGRAGVDSILIGPGSLEHLESAIAACASALDENVRTKVDAVWLEMAGTDATYAR